MKLKLLVLLVLSSGYFKAYAQCDSFKVDFQLGASSSAVKTCAPAHYSFQDNTVLNFGDEFVECDWNVGPLDSQHNVFTISYPGSYDVKLRVKTKNGCEDSMLRKDYLKVLGSNHNFQFDHSVYCYEETPLLIDSTDWTGRNASISLDGETWFDIDGSLGKYPFYLMGRGGYSPLVRIKEDLRNPENGRFEECFQLYPPPFTTERRKILFKKDPLQVHYSQRNGYWLMDSAHLYDDYHWVVYSGKDSVIIRDSDKVKQDAGTRIELVVNDGRCEGREMLFFQSIAEATLSANMHYSIEQSRLSLAPSGNGILSIFGLDGVKVYQQSVGGDQQIDLVFLPKGVYIAAFEGAQRISTLRLIRN